MFSCRKRLEMSCLVEASYASLNKLRNPKIYTSSQPYYSDGNYYSHCWHLKCRRSASQIRAGVFKTRVQWGFLLFDSRQFSLLSIKVRERELSHIEPEETSLYIFRISRPQINTSWASSRFFVFFTVIRLGRMRIELFPEGWQLCWETGSSTLLCVLFGRHNIQDALED